MCGNLQHMFNILRMFEEIGSDNESEEPNSQNVHLKKKKSNNSAERFYFHSSIYCFRPHWRVPCSICESPKW